MFHRDRVEMEYADLVRDKGMGNTTWSPLASGFLSGKYNDGVPEGSRLSLERFDWLKAAVLGQGVDAKIAKLRELDTLAKDLGGTLAQLAIAWAASHPHVSSVITGASRVSQVEENMAAVDLIPKLTASVRDDIDQILGNRPVAERDWRDG